MSRRKCSAHDTVCADAGNVNQTIIFGESAGAGSVSTQVAMRKSWGLFQGAISQSGGFQRWVAKPLADAEKNYASVTMALGCGTGAAAVDCLVGKTAAELLAHSEAVRLPSTDGWDSCQWSPVIDGVELEQVRAPCASLRLLLRLLHTFSQLHNPARRTQT